MVRFILNFAVVWELLKFLCRLPNQRAEFPRWTKTLLGIFTLYAWKTSILKEKIKFRAFRRVARLASAINKVVCKIPIFIHTERVLKSRENELKDQRKSKNRGRRLVFVWRAIAASNRSVTYLPHSTLSNIFLICNGSMWTAFGKSIVKYFVSKHKTVNDERN